MDMLKGRAMYKGWKTVPFTPGKFYDVQVSISGKQLTVSVPDPSSEGRKCPSMSYKNMSDFYYDWVFTFPEDREDFPEPPIIHEYSHYHWTKSCRYLIDAYAQALKAVNIAIDQCDKLFSSNELTYLLRTRDALREMRPSLAKVTAKPVR